MVGAPFVADGEFYRATLKCLPVTLVAELALSQSIIPGGMLALAGELTGKLEQEMAQSDGQPPARSWKIREILLFFFFWVEKNEILVCRL